MKHSDFLRSLKTLKSRLLETKKRHHFCHNPIAKNEEKTYCICKDSSGEAKYLYTSQKEIDYILASKNISLHVYPCPYEKGWHLTKS